MSNTFYQRIIGVASLLGLLGVCFGAFGAHFLKTRLSEPELETLRTGVLYLFIHCCMAITTALLAVRDEESRILKGAGVFYLLGVVLFSGSLFYIATKSLTGLPVGPIGILTPIGGVFFITGWAMLALYALSRKS